MNHKIHCLGTLERSGNALRELGYVAYGPQTFYLLKSPEHRDPIDLRYLKQRTDEWLNAREDGAMSSSEIGTALNFYGLEKAKAIQEKIWRKVSMEDQKQVSLWRDKFNCSKL